MVEVAGVEAVGGWELVSQKLEGAGRGRHQQEEVQAAEAAALVQWAEPAAGIQVEGGQLVAEGAARVQTEAWGAFSLARVQAGVKVARSMYLF